MKIGFLLLLCIFLCACHNESNHPTENDSTDTSANTSTRVTKKTDALPSSDSYPDSIDKENLLKAEISRRDSSFSVFGNIRKDYRIFGYDRPDTSSRRMILFSVFTRDVDRNPHKCPYGAFYQSSSMENAKIKYKSVVGSFIATELYVDDRKVADLYFERKWIEFTD